MLEQICQAKERPSAKRQDLAYGDTWTWTAIEADTKLLITWPRGGWDGDYAINVAGFVQASRLFRSLQ